MSVTDQITHASSGVSGPALWREMSSAIAAMERIVYDDPRVVDDLTRAEGVRYLTRLIAGGIALTLEGWDWRHPRLIKFLSTGVQFGLPAADCHYQTAAVHGDHTYRITGSRGTSRMFDVETRKGFMAKLGDWSLIDRRSEFEIGEDGRVEVVLSQEEQPGNWIRLADGPGSIIVRQYYYDWLTEEPAILRIDRDGAEYPAAPVTVGAIEERMRLLIDWLQALPPALQYAVSTYYDAPERGFVYGTLDYGWADLQYGKATYALDREQAAIVEFRPPEAPYWAIQLCSHYWEARDWHLRQSSLNGQQATLDDDGIFRAVISQRDPGIPNWLDTGDHPTGLVTLRLYKAADRPAPTIRAVGFDELAGALPAGTPAVSAAEREASVRARAHSVYRRMCD
jgi:hypothetical protein